MRSVYRRLSLPQNGWQVLGADLNCSELSGGTASPFLRFPSKALHTMVQQKIAALRDFNPADVRIGSFATRQCPRDVRYTSDRYQFPASQRNDAMCQKAT